MVQNNYSLLPDKNGDSDDPGGALDLKAIRESKGLTLKDIFKMTRISVVNLEAIENNDLHLLPAPVYTKTFIKTYAKALGVDSRNILERYAKHLESLKEPLPERQEAGPSRKPVIPPRVAIWSVAVIVFCSLVFLSLALHTKSDPEVRNPVPSPTTAEPVAEAPAAPFPAAVTAAPQAAETPVVLPEKAIPAAQPTVPAEKSVAAATPRPAPAAASTPQNTAEAEALPAQYRLTITAKELTWLKIMSDQNPPDEVMLQPGEKINRNAAASIRLDIGNAGGIDAEFQGKSLGSLGKSGEVVHLTLP